MAGTEPNPEHLAKLREALDVGDIGIWNNWVAAQRAADPEFRINLRGAYLRKADLRNADLAGANLIDADLYWAKLHNADLTNASLQGATLREVRFWGATLKGTNFSGASLRDASFKKADVEGAKIQAQSVLRRQVADTKQGRILFPEIPLEEMIAKVTGRGPETTVSEAKASGAQPDQSQFFNRVNENLSEISPIEVLFDTLQNHRPRQTEDEAKRGRRHKAERLHRFLPDQSSELADIEKRASSKEQFIATLKALEARGDDVSEVMSFEIELLAERYRAVLENIEVLIGPGTGRLEIIQELLEKISTPDACQREAERMVEEFIQNLTARVEKVAEELGIGETEGKGPGRE